MSGRGPRAGGTLRQVTTCNTLSPGAKGGPRYELVLQCGHKVVRVVAGTRAFCMACPAGSGWKPYRGRQVPQG